MWRNLSLIYKCNYIDNWKKTHKNTFKKTSHMHLNCTARNKKKIRSMHYIKEQYTLYFVEIMSWPFISRILAKSHYIRFVILETHPRSTTCTRSRPAYFLFLTVTWYKFGHYSNNDLNCKNKSLWLHIQPSIWNVV